MSKQNSLNGLRRWLVDSLDIPADVIEGGFRVDLRGRSQLVVHGCKKILDYSPIEIRLEVWKCVVCINGKGLSCNSYLSGAVGIDGRIEAITLEED